MARIDATIDDDLNERLETEAAENGKKKSGLIREILEAHYDAPASPQIGVAPSDDVKALTAKIDALTRYLCLSRPIDDTIDLDEEKAGKRSWLKVREWEVALLKKTSS